MSTIHASCLLVGSAGVLVRGPSGAGKSALVLALLEARWAAGGYAALIGDDRIELQPSGGRLIARAPAPIRGLIEQRGGGLRQVASLEAAVLRLIVDLVPQEALERMPEVSDLSAPIEGLSLPRQAVPRGDLTRQISMVFEALRQISGLSPAQAAIRDRAVAHF